MNAQEIAICKEFVDKMLPEILAAEEAHLPAAYAPLASAIVTALLPAAQAYLDAKLADIVPAPAAT